MPTVRMCRRLTHFEIPGKGSSGGNPAWSPDGKQIAIQPWFVDQDGSPDSRPITVVDVATGDVHEVGPANSMATPAGLVARREEHPRGPQRPSPYADRVLVVDAVTGEVTETV